MELFLAYLPQFALVAALTLIEQWRNPARSDWWINLQAWVISLLVGLTILPLFRPGGLPSLLDGAALPFWIGFPIFFVASDLGEYLFHRAQHRIPFMWAMHSLHHSDPEMSALTTQRHFWADQLLKGLTIWAAAGMVVAPTPAILAAAVLVNMWHFVVHSRLRIDLGRWSWLVNAPAYHRRHHSVLPEHHDSNFAAFFPVFDVICGSYYRPAGFPPTGLDRAPRRLHELIAWPLHFAGRGATARVAVSEA
jgi:sterol desaturase/sphingolipid hydroxylase (fatty acid hydroxylase superfamily)